MCDGGEALPKDDVAAVEGEVDGGVEDDEEGVEHDQVLGPGLEVGLDAGAADEHVDDLVHGDHDLKNKNQRNAKTFFTGNMRSVEVKPTLY